MAFNSATQPFSMQSKRASFGHGSSTNASLLLEKTKANIRRSTPDSEALASSDDEQEQQQRLAQVTGQQAPRPIRRASLLGETHGPSQRKSSLSGNDTFPPPIQHGTSAGVDVNPWASPPSAVNRNSAAGATFPWGNTIWNEPQKGPPARLAEVLPSPSGPTSSSFAEEPIASPISRHDSTSEAAIPFAIPLHPTLKTYRSQSYSVGQLDQELVNPHPRQGQLGAPTRARAGSSYAGLQNRLSRPSMLGDFSPDTSILEQLREVDDDDEISTASSEAGVRLPAGTNTRTIEQLAIENAILRQQAYANNASIAQATTTPGDHYSVHSHPSARLSSRSGQISDSVLEEPDDIGAAATEDNAAGHILKRPSPPAFAENRALENVKKGHWQTSLGFGGMTNIPQSRRHSFADIPLRSPAGANGGDGRFNGLGELRSGTYGEDVMKQGHSDSSEYANFLRPLSHCAPIPGVENLQRVFVAASYFSNPLSRSSDTYRPPSSSSSIHQSFNGPQSANVMQPSRPTSQASQQLYLVTFKAARAEFYYVQEGTGLEVNNGDLVIVEADRGTDLGTVAHKNVDWHSAKQLKERYVMEHYNWLIMFSRQGQSGQLASSSSQAMLNAGARLFSGSTSGILGPSAHGTSTEITPFEIKPKMIKRLAQPHEIHMLRDKEGNEAKAKRMCQQKVAEHHLNMEILDAEFQMDWKKLTFYYYADAYVNFNSLVTDLFKIYKTRIWMSAINPASFVSPTAGAQLDPGAAQGVSQRERQRFTEARSKADEFGLGAASFSTVGTDNPDVGWADARGGSLTSSTPQTAYGQYFNPQPHNFTSHGIQLDDFGRGLYSPFRSSSPVAFQHYGPPGVLRGVGPMNSQYREDADKNLYHEQINAFQGLSLGS